MGRNTLDVPLRGQSPCLSWVLSAEFPSDLSNRIHPDVLWRGTQGRPWSSHTAELKEEHTCWARVRRDHLPAAMPGPQQQGLEHLQFRAMIPSPWERNLVVWLWSRWINAPWVIPALGMHCPNKKEVHVFWASCLECFLEIGVKRGRRGRWG